MLIIKEKNTRNSIISILSSLLEPMTARQIYYKLRKNNLRVSYQAVYKELKELIKVGVLENKDKRYFLDMGWVNNNYIFFKNLKFNLIIKNRSKNKGYFVPDLRVLKFLDEVGSKVNSYVGNDKVAVLSVVGGGFNLSNHLRNYLLSKNKDVNYIEINRYNPKLSKSQVNNRKIIVVDSSIHSGTTYKRIMKALNKIKKKYNVKDIKYSVEYDVAGLADFSCSYKDATGEEPMVMSL